MWCYKSALVSELVLLTALLASSQHLNLLIVFNYSYLPCQPSRHCYLQPFWSIRSLSRRIRFRLLSATIIRVFLIHPDESWNSMAPVCFLPVGPGKWHEVDLHAPRRPSTGIPQGSVLGALLFFFWNRSLDEVISSHGLWEHWYCWWRKVSSITLPQTLMLISVLSIRHKLLFIPGDSSTRQDLVISLDDSQISPSVRAHSLEVTMVLFLSHCTLISPLLHQKDSFVSFHTGHSEACSVSWHLQTGLLLLAPGSSASEQHLTSEADSEGAVRLVYNLPRFSHTTHLLLHWIPVADCIRFKTWTISFLVFEAQGFCNHSASMCSWNIWSKIKQLLLNITETIKTPPDV